MPYSRELQCPRCNFDNSTGDGSLEQTTREEGQNCLQVTVDRYYLEINTTSRFLEFRLDYSGTWKGAFCLTPQVVQYSLFTTLWAMILEAFDQWEYMIKRALFPSGSLRITTSVTYLRNFRAWNKRRSQIWLTQASFWFKSSRSIEFRGALFHCWEGLHLLSAVDIALRMLKYK